MVYQTPTSNSSSPQTQRMRPNRRPGPSVPPSTPAGTSPSPCEFSVLPYVFNEWGTFYRWSLHSSEFYSFFCTHLVSWKRQIRTAACPLRFGTGTEPPGTTSWAPCRSECLSWSKLPTVDGQWPLRSITYRKWLYAFHYVWSTCEVLWSHDPPDSDQTRMATRMMIIMEDIKEQNSY